MTSYDGETITYDAIGNPTTYRGATLTWSGRQLTSYTKDDLTITYKYDANGLRTQKTVNGLVYDYGYENGLLVYERIGNQYEINYRYDENGNLFTFTRLNYADNSKTFVYAVNNTRGDLIELRTGSGVIYAKYTYDSWGNLISVTNKNGTALASTHTGHYNSIRYRGYVYDQETGLYYLQSRYYDPETGRFLNADDVEYIGYSGEDISYNMFAYCENNAVNCLDVSGYITKKINEKINYNLAIKCLEAVVAHILPSKKIREYVDFYRDKNYIYSVTVKYTETEYTNNIKDKEVDLIFGHRNAWKKASVWYNNFNEITSNYSEYMGGVMSEIRGPEDVYAAAFPVVFLLGLIVGEIFKASRYKKNYDMIWGENGKDPDNSLGYYLIEVKWEDRSKKEYYIYSWILEAVFKYEPNK